MQILDNFIIVSLIILSFIAGLRVDNWYHMKALADKKDALERQFIRLRARADADDPCRPYGKPTFPQPIPVQFNTGDHDGDGPINEAFMEKLKATGHAKTAFRKADVAK